MQIIVVAPEAASVAANLNATLTREICGVGLLERTLATAQRVGASEILLVWPGPPTLELANTILQSSLLNKKDSVRLVRVEHFDPNTHSSWTNLQSQLEEQFIWLPWNWVTYARALAKLSELKQSSPDWGGPTWASKIAVVSDANPRPRIGPIPEGVAVTSDNKADAAERFLVAYSGKASDGIHTSFNRLLCRPAVRWLSHTRVTPNAVTFAGVVVAIFSAIAFARGNYWSYVAGALLFFVSGLFDEMDGMLARIKFSDSPFGTYLESHADSLSYLLLFGGITMGLYREHGDRELWIGAALLIGVVLALVITTLQRKRAAGADRPSEYLGNFCRKLEQDSSNGISRAVRQAQGFQRRGILIHYVVLFTVFGGLPVFFYLATLGAHLTWMLALYYNQRFFKQATAGVLLSKIQATQERS
jgi:phosphatidylglycerophosphate synthase